MVLVSFAISPHLWIDWIRLLADGGNHAPPADGVKAAYDVPAVYRLPVALAIAVWAAAKNRRGWLVLTIGLASPVFTLTALMSNLAVLAALPRLRSDTRAESSPVSGRLPSLALDDVRVAVAPER